MRTERTADTDLLDAICSYRWALNYVGFLCKEELIVRYRKSVSNIFYKIHGFMPVEAYFDAIAAAPEKTDYAAFGMASIADILEGV